MIQINGHQLQPGDIIKHKMGNDTYIVTANYGSYAIAVRAVHVSNPSEWEFVDPANWRSVSKRRNGILGGQHAVGEV